MKPGSDILPQRDSTTIPSKGASSDLAQGSVKLGEKVPPNEIVIPVSLSADIENLRVNPVLAPDPKLSICCLCGYEIEKIDEMKIECGHLSHCFCAIRQEINRTFVYASCTICGKIISREVRIMAVKGLTPD